MQRVTAFQTHVSTPSPLRHSRQFSDSTVASSAPSTPVALNTGTPAIIDLDCFMNSPAATFNDTGYQAKAEDTVGVADSHNTMAHIPVVIKPGTVTAEDVPDSASSHHSNSSNGQDTPETPGSSNGVDEKRPGSSRQEYLPRKPIELFRTESAACQDELFNERELFVHTKNSAAKNKAAAANPANSSAPLDSNDPHRTSQQSLLSPTSRDLVSERLRIANSVRKHLPDQDLSRERSPFRQGAELAPPPPSSTSYPRAPSSLLPTAASLRQQQKEQADQQEIRAHQPRLRRELTKTISPKDAVLDAPNDADNANSMSLFDDIIPHGYQKHFGASEIYPNNFVSGTNQAFGQFVPMNQNTMGGFRGLDLNNWLATPVANAPAHAINPPSSSQRSDKTPEFPAQLVTMESSVSDNPPVSSQDSMTSPPIMRPENTSANTGTYACTFPKCTLRFDTSIKLARHKREIHQNTPSVHQSTPSIQSSASPSEIDADSATPESQADSASGMTSSSLKNNSTGPHKCTRINPTTGKPCNTVFSRPYDLTRHEDTIHNKVRHKVQCQYCREEKTFSRNDALTRHLRVVHPEVDFQGKRGKKE